MIRLGVGLRAIAAMRTLAGGREPDLVAAVHACKLGGADHVIVRAAVAKTPITERDVRLLVEAGSLPLTLALEPTADLVAWAIAAKPAAVLLAPTTAGQGLDFARDAAVIERSVADLRTAGLPVVAAVEPDEAALVAATGAGVDVVLLATGRLGGAAAEDARVVAFGAIARAAATAQALMLRVHAGGGLALADAERVATIGAIESIAVGRAVCARAVFEGLARATEVFARRIGAVVVDDDVPTAGAAS